MGKTLFVLELEEARTRKKLAPPAKKHKSKKCYSRKDKHKGLRDTAPGQAGGFFRCGTTLPHRCHLRIEAHSNHVPVAHIPLAR